DQRIQPGLRIKSPGLPSAATLGPAIRESNPGCGSKAQGCRPRLPWDPRSENPTPNGLRIKSPGLPSAATLGPAIRESNPFGVEAYCLLPHKNHVQLLRAVNAYNQRELDVRGSARASYEGDRTWSFVGRIKLNEELIQTRQYLLDPYERDVNPRQQRCGSGSTRAR